MRIIIGILTFAITCNCYAKSTYEYEVNNVQFKVVKKKKKLILSCKPATQKNAKNNIWISECNNLAFNLLTTDKIQALLVNKEVKDYPFGRISYQTAKETGASFMLRKAIRKSFKIHKK